MQPYRHFAIFVLAASMSFTLGLAAFAAPMIQRDVSCTEAEVTGPAQPLEANPADSVPDAMAENEVLSSLLTELRALREEVERLRGSRPGTAQADLSLPGLAELGPLPIVPVHGTISSPFGMRTHPISGQRRMHRGIDIVARRGTPVRCVLPGTVLKSGWKPGYGIFVYVRHSDDIETRYGHLDELYVRDGQRVFEGEVLGTLGSTGKSTGAHLHFEIREHGTPKDPQNYLPQTEQVIAKAGKETKPK